VIVDDKDADHALLRAGVPPDAATRVPSGATASRARAINIGSKSHCERSTNSARMGIDGAQSFIDQGIGEFSCRFFHYHLNADCGKWGIGEKAPAPARFPPSPWTTGCKDKEQP
jgi:hypothetical protein